MQFEQGMQQRAVQDLSRPPALPSLKPDYVQVLLKSSVKEVTTEERRGEEQEDEEEGRVRGDGEEDEEEDGDGEVGESEEEERSRGM
eukprot:759611-Hanusia_phi.AAC.2